MFQPPIELSLVNHYPMDISIRETDSVIPGKDLSRGQHQSPGPGCSKAG